MNKRLRKFEKQSGLEIYSLGKDREKWEKALITYSQLVIDQVIETINETTEKINDGTINMPGKSSNIWYGELTIKDDENMKYNFCIENYSRMNSISDTKQLRGYTRGLIRGLILELDSYGCKYDKIIEMQDAIKVIKEFTDYEEL